MVRATRVANPLSRALGAGVGIGGLVAALFLMANPGIAKQSSGATTLPAAVKVMPSS